MKIVNKLRSFLYKYGNRAIWKFRNAAFLRQLSRRHIKFITRKLEIGPVKFLFTISVRDRGLSRQLFTNNWREYTSTLYLLEDFLGTDEVVIDIGANLGYFALIEAAFSKNNLVYALEPVPDAFTLLQFNIALNRLSNIFGYRLGISDSDGTKDITVSEFLNWSTFNKDFARFICSTQTNVRSIPVEVLKLSTFYERYMEKPPTMVRMDVEGYEYEIFNGNRDFFEKYPLKIFLEFHTNLLGKAKSLEILKLLSNSGYVLERLISNLEYCLHELVFKPPKGRGYSRKISFQQYYKEIAGKTENQVRSEDGCMIFCKKA